ncbi:MAG: hypothetical protein SCARUB_04239 [Candidatus Scalindua rubra]|uniref:Uncharacterized protein n=1 Tax=Candidatus Scalindua rubra TaxID=1872076 RepID=A0A1E3X4S6_9BACT|nr:MAG: hypothetical protein SCARUB_04239 [Candidatus Scalindua rubra]
MKVPKKFQKDIEFWEKYYLDQMSFMLLQDKTKMINALNSKDEIKSDWIDVFIKKSCDIDRGAERIYFWLFNQLGIPNSTPIGSDLLYETSNAFLHIDVKTSSYYYGKDKKRNTSDFFGVVPIGHNQTSYEYVEQKGGKQIKHTSNLPPIYKTKNKLCLTYIIQLVYDRAEDGDLIIISIYLISVPNGLLKSVYGDNICGGSKNKNEAFRYYYKRDPKFSLCPNKPYRIAKLYLREGFTEKDILDFEIK